MLLEPQPDPAWEYAEIWQHLNATGDRLVDLIVYLAEKGTATPDVDKTVKELLDAIGQQLNSTRRLVDE